MKGCTCQCRWFNFERPTVDRYFRLVRFLQLLNQFSCKSLCSMFLLDKTLSPLPTSMFPSLDTVKQPLFPNCLVTVLLFTSSYGVAIIFLHVLETILLFRISLMDRVERWCAMTAFLLSLYWPLLRHSY